MGNVEVLTYNRQLSERAVKMNLRPGDVFNTKLIEDFYNDNKSLFPTEFSPTANIEIRQDPRKWTVTIVIDARTCPQ